MKAWRFILSGIISCSLLAAQLNIINVEAITVGTPIENSFYFQGESNMYSGGLIKDTNLIQITYIHRDALDSNDYTETSWFSFNPGVNAHSFCETYTTPYYTTGSFPYPLFFGSDSHYGSYFRFKAYHTDGTITSELKKCSIVLLSRSAYQNSDSTFYYNYFAGSSFEDTATGRPYNNNNSITYNCMAYAFNQVADGWAWSDTFDTYSDNRSTVKNYVLNEYGYTENVLSNHAYADAIAYGVSNHVTHFAKVSKMAANGVPTAITSKWGAAELISSKNIDPFTSSSGYGHPLIYFDE